MAVELALATDVRDALALRDVESEELALVEGSSDARGEGVASGDNEVEGGVVGARDGPPLGTLDAERAVVNVHWQLAPALGNGVAALLAVPKMDGLAGDVPEADGASSSVPELVAVLVLLESARVGDTLELRIGVEEAVAVGVDDTETADVAVEVEVGDPVGGAGADKVEVVEASGVLVGVALAEGVRERLSEALRVRDPLAEGRAELVGVRVREAVEVADAEELEDAEEDIDVVALEDDVSEGRADAAGDTELVGERVLVGVPERDAVGERVDDAVCVSDDDALGGRDVDGDGDAWSDASVSGA